MKQQCLFNLENNNEFGGSLETKGQRKKTRPLNFKSPIHLVLKVDDSVQLFLNAKIVVSQIEKLSRKFGVKVYSLAVHEDHIHGVIKLPGRRLYQAWIRSITGTLCRKIRGLKWRFLPFTKILTWGKQFKVTLNYLQANRVEAEFLESMWIRFYRFEEDIRNMVSFQLQI